jgi:hypothetical protein
LNMINKIIAMIIEKIVSPLLRLASGCPSSSDTPDYNDDLRGKLFSSGCSSAAN